MRSPERGSFMSDWGWDSYTVIPQSRWIRALRNMGYVSFAPMCSTRKPTRIRTASKLNFEFIQVNPGAMGRLFRMSDIIRRMSPAISKNGLWIGDLVKISSLHNIGYVSHTLRSWLIKENSDLSFIQREMKWSEEKNKKQAATQKIVTICHLNCISTQEMGTLKKPSCLMQFDIISGVNKNRQLGLIIIWPYTIELNRRNNMRTHSRNHMKHSHYDMNSHRLNVQFIPFNKNNYDGW